MLKDQYTLSEHAHLRRLTANQYLIVGMQTLTTPCVESVCVYDAQLSVFLTRYDLVDPRTAEATPPFYADDNRFLLADDKHLTMFQYDLKPVTVLDGIENQLRKNTEVRTPLLAPPPYWVPRPPHCMLPSVSPAPSLFAPFC